MSFLSGLSNIFHGIGHIFDNQDDEQKKKQNQSAQPTVVRPTQAPVQTQNNVVQPVTPQAAQVPNVNLNPTVLQKVNPTSAPKAGSYDPNGPFMKNVAAENAANPAAPVNKNSIGYKITHNPVTDLAGSIVKPAAELTHAVVRTPEMLAADIQGFQGGAGGRAASKKQAALQQEVFGTNDGTQLLKKIIGDTVGTGLLVAAPGIDSLVEKGASEVLPDAANVVLRKVAPKVVSGGSQAAAFGANSTASEGGNLKQTLESAGTNFVVGGATAGFFSGIPVLAKAVHDGHITPQAADSATKVADGVHTVNPNRPTDAAAQMGVPPEAPPAGPAVPTPSVPAESAPAPSLADPALVAQSHTGQLSHFTTPENAASIRANGFQAPKTKAAQGDAAYFFNGEGKGLGSTDVPGNTRVGAKLAPDAKILDTSAADYKGPSPTSGNKLKKYALANGYDGVTDGTQTAVYNTEKVIPDKEASTPKPGTTAPNAPGIRAAAQKKLDSLGGNAGDATTHDVLSNQELLDAGKAHADTFNDTQLVNQYKNGFTPTNAADIAKGHAALDRLNEIARANPSDKNAAKAIDNILAGAEQGFSGGGRTVNYAQQFYDGLKGPAKTSYLIRQIDKVREAAGLPLLRDDENAMLAATQKVDSHVTTEENIKSKIATLEARLEEIKTAAKEGNGSKDLTKEANHINEAIKQHQLDLSKNTSDLGKFYDNVAPLKQGTQQKVGDLGRSLMLSSIAGRGNDIATTGINAAHQLLQQTVEATAGKLTKTGKNIDTLPSPAAIARGVKFGLKKSVQRFQGNVAAGDASALLKKVDTGSGKGQLLSRTDGTKLSKVVAPIHRVVRSATEIATDLSEGMKESRIQQLAAQEGKKAGLTGEDLKSYTAATTASPSRAMADAGTQLRDEVNNMHDNKISDALSEVSKGLGHVPVVGEQIRNLTLPFTRWTGGQLHNALVDKNVAVNLGQFVKAATKGDEQGMITAASKVAVNGVASIGAGYTLAKAGLLTHQNAQGYNDDGVYLHIGGRYIPAAFLGFFAPGIILGSAAHDAMKDNGGGKGNILTTALDTFKKDAVNSFLAYSGQSLTGTTNPVQQEIAGAASGKNTYGDAAVTAGGQVAGQYIPAATNDANAVINNGLKIGGKTIVPDTLNPTHEAALTKVEKGASGTLTKTGKPSKAKDVTQTVKNQLLNKVPFASQNLPRNKGVAANDEFDRLTRGSRDTGAEIKARADAKTAADVSADFAKRGVPDPNASYATGDSFDNAVENRVENGKYDQAIEGLNAKLAKVKSSPDATTKQTDPIDKQIKTIQVLKDGKYDPKIRDDYSHTSLSEWRDMGDPTSDNYDVKRYEELYNYDKALAGKGVSSSTKDGNTPKFSLKDTSKSSAKKAASDAQYKITSNKLGNTPNLPTIDLSSLSPTKISTTAKIPTIQQVQPGDLIKKRAISVSRTR